MGTRHLTVINDIDNREIVVLYGQWDGYLSGHGKELKEFLDGFYIVNGYNLEDQKEGVKAANGMGCLAGQIVAHFKKKLGSFHLEPAGTRNIGEEYIYTIYTNAKKENYYSLNQGKFDVYIRVTTKHGNKTLYDGPVSKFNPEEE